MPTVTPSSSAPVLERRLSPLLGSDIFIGAVQRDGPGERGAYLEDACGADAALRRRVEGLLEVYDRAGSFLEEPAAPPTGAEIN